MYKQYISHDRFYSVRQKRVPQSGRWRNPKEVADQLGYGIGVNI